jgi:zinc transport system ATP-binding protein
MNDFAVEVKNLSVKFEDHVALAELSMQIPKNSFVAIVGPNGAGKSTFLKILLGLISPTTGQVKIFGKTPQQVDPNLIGYVPQFKTMDRSFPAVSIELVYTGLSRKWPWRLGKDARQKACQALDQVGAAHLATRSIGTLSGGELQRVCLARSIVRQPKILMLDEPATGIDAIGEEDMYRMLEAYQKESGATVMMITHDWHAVTHHANYVLLLNRKQISFGSPGTALQEDKLRKAYGHIGHQHALKFLMNSNGVN